MAILAENKKNEKEVENGGDHKLGENRVDGK